jgi:hypothetical protein
MDTIWALREASVPIVSVELIAFDTDIDEDTSRLTK